MCCLLFTPRLLGASQHRGLTDLCAGEAEQHSQLGLAQGDLLCLPPKHAPALGLPLALCTLTSDAGDVPPAPRVISQNRWLAATPGLEHAPSSFPPLPFSSICTWSHPSGAQLGADRSLRVPAHAGVGFVLLLPAEGWLRTRHPHCMVPRSSHASVVPESHRWELLLLLKFHGTNWDGGSYVTEAT